MAVLSVGESILMSGVFFHPYESTAPGAAVPTVLRVCVCVVIDLAADERWSSHSEMSATYCRVGQMKSRHCLRLLIEGKKCFKRK